MAFENLKKMTQLLQEKIQKGKAILKQIEGEYTYAMIESSFYKNTSLWELFEPLKNTGQVQVFTSDHASIDFFGMYAQSTGTRNRLSKDGLLLEIRLNFQNTWSFCKLYNSARHTNVQNLDEQMNLVIAETLALLTELNEDYLGSEIFHFAAHGYDYSLVAIEFEEGVQVIEYLWYID